MSRRASLAPSAQCDDGQCKFVARPRLPSSRDDAGSDAVAPHGPARARDLFAQPWVEHPTAEGAYIKRYGDAWQSVHRSVGERAQRQRPRPDWADGFYDRSFDAAAPTETFRDRLAAAMRPYCGCNGGGATKKKAEDEGRGRPETVDEVRKQLARTSVSGAGSCPMKRASES